ncbi:hypothetical protein SLA2020_378140 [Shorea laevis]
MHKFPFLQQASIRLNLLIFPCLLSPLLYLILNHPSPLLTRHLHKFPLLLHSLFPLARIPSRPPFFSCPSPHGHPVQN